MRLLPLPPPSSLRPAWRLLAALAAGVSGLSPALPAQTDLATWRVRAGQGDAEALNALGNAYALGQGVPRDDNEALRHYEAAANAGHAPACFNLGLIHELGRGVPRNEAEAARWYRLAAAQNHPRAALQLAVLLEDGRGVARDEAEAARLYRMAAEQGIGAAQTSLGLMLAAGRGGLPVNLPEATAWLTLAVEQGAPPASRDLVLARLTAEQRAQSETILAGLRGRLSEAAPVVPVAPAPVADVAPLAPDADARADATAAAAVTVPVPDALPADGTALADLRASVVQLRTENRELSTALNEAERNVSRLEGEVAAARSAAIATPVATTASAALQATNTSLQADLAGARATIEEKLELIAQLTDELALMKAASVPAAGTTPTEAAQPSAEMALLQADAAALRERVETLSGELATRTRERDEAVAARVRPVPAVEGPAPAGLSDQAIWTGRLAEANALAERQRTQAEALALENTALGDELRRLEGEVAQLAGAVRVLRGDNARLAAQVGVAPATGSAPVLRVPPPVATVTFAPGRALPTRPGTAAPVMVTPPPAAERIHTVAPGDSLSALSLRYYGNARRWNAIFEANRDVLRTPDRLRPGQRLRIP